ncbi:transcriptional regulator [Xanthomonas bromi]|uniref:Transcriptional regulator n=1 Tax=Xanthomonas bromi TaxID=56449 RepID=A0A1C3NIS8_9XANT|nr:transcriptional regulator [Xanthomonas bromi]
MIERQLCETDVMDWRCFSRLTKGQAPGSGPQATQRMSNTDYYSAIVPQASSAVEMHAPLMIDLLAYIERHIGEAELDTESLQQAFALSRASLYRLFQSRGAVASYIREQRLCTAHRYLQAYRIAA